MRYRVELVGGAAKRTDANRMEDGRAWGDMGFLYEVIDTQAKPASCVVCRCTDRSTALRIAQALGAEPQALGVSQAA
jgi:hypothetical protein